MPVTIGQESAKQTPASGYGNIYPKTDGELYYTDESANETQLTGVAALDITGSRADTEAALANLLTALATLGLITDSTTT